eukprot:m.4651 g.4651  ORF g.4651 m.4651 type:complete len:75 (+) comp11064_c0_seq1:1426-1650(+)
MVKREANLVPVTLEADSRAMVTHGLAEAVSGARHLGLHLLLQWLKKVGIDHCKIVLPIKKLCFEVFDFEFVFSL